METQHSQLQAHILLCIFCMGFSYKAVSLVLIFSDEPIFRPNLFTNTLNTDCLSMASRY